MIDDMVATLKVEQQDDEAQQKWCAREGLRGARPARVGLTRSGVLLGCLEHPSSTSERVRYLRIGAIVSIGRLDLLKFTLFILK